MPYPPSTSKLRLGHRQPRSFTRFHLPSNFLNFRYCDPTYKPPICIKSIIEFSPSPSLITIKQLIKVATPHFLNFLVSFQESLILILDASDVGKSFVFMSLVLMYLVLASLQIPFSPPWCQLLVQVLVNLSPSYHYKFYSLLHL